MSKSIVLVISAPSGAGKTTQEELLRQRRGFVNSISDTTRPPRPGEVDGVHYNFIKPAEFNHRAGNCAYAEHAVVFGYHYGTPSKVIFSALETGTNLLLTIDTMGYRSIKNHTNRQLAATVQGIFLMPPSLVVLEERLRSRGGMSEEKILRRLNDAPTEMARASEYDLIITTHDIEHTYAQIVKFIEKHS